ncbi:MAG: hypothetical protein IJU80_07155 [Lachnospiraceae bacterium]|nr:hypothetical protein [Lachnospiraceae bacterium]
MCREAGFLQAVKSYENSIRDIQYMSIGDSKKSSGRLLIGKGIIRHGKPEIREEEQQR